MKQNGLVHQYLILLLLNLIAF